MKKILLMTALVAVAFAGCDKKPNPVQKEPANYIQINDGTKQEILTQAFALYENGYSLALSMVNLTDRLPSQTIRSFNIELPIEFINTELDMATSTLNGEDWGLWMGFINGLTNYCNFWWENYSTTGTLKVSRGTGNNFTIDLTDFVFNDGTKVSLHFEGDIDEVSTEDWKDGPIVIYDIDLNAGSETFKYNEIGWVEIDAFDNGGVMCSDIWGGGDYDEDDNSNFYYDIYFADPAGGVFTDTTYSAWDGESAFTTPVYFDSYIRMKKGEEYGLYLADGSTGTIKFEKNADGTAFTMTFTNVLLDDETTLISGTIKADGNAPLPTGSDIPAKMPIAKKATKKHNR